MAFERSADLHQRYICKKWKVVFKMSDKKRELTADEVLFSKKYLEKQK